MAMHFCFNFDGREVCFDIPILVNRFPIEPDPVITGDGIDVEVSRQLQAVASIASAVEALPKSHQEAFNEALRPAINALERRIPGSKIRFHPKNGGGPGPDANRPSEIS